MSAASDSRRSPDRLLFTGAALVAALVVFTGFSRSYYLKAFFDSPALPSLLVHLHGIVMTLWFALFLVQARLIATHRTQLHRKLGLAGIGLAVLVVVVGCFTAIVAAKAGRAPPGPPPLVFLAIPLGDMVVFAILFTLAIQFRRLPDFHKRLMLLASLSMLTAAIARFPIPASAGLPLFFGLMDALLLACIAFDTIRNRRLHPAFGWGFLLVFLSQGARLAGAGTPQWQQFARWLTDAICPPCPRT